MEPTTFNEMTLSDPIRRAIADLGFEEPTPIQAQCIKILMEGHDLTAQAQTGTGKTAAFGIPMLESITPGGRTPQGLILAPTRELAIQDAEAIHAYGKYIPVRVVPIYGGQSIERQFQMLRRGTDIVVGTPGRLMDHMRRGTLSLEAIKMVVLDEADEMLNMGFVEDIEFILGQLPSKRQTALFSATIPSRIRILAGKYLQEPQHVSVSQDRLTVPQVRQLYYEVSGRNKLDALTRILDVGTPASAIIFTRTKRDAGELADNLAGLGYLAEPIHGDLSQTERDRVMRRFRDGMVELLVATDVAARGLDIPEVSHVINYDVPVDPEAYVHRIGRTGRAGRKGEAITLVTPGERNMLRMIERLTRHRLQVAHLPTLADVAAQKRETLKATLRTMLEGDGLAPYLLVVEDLAGDYNVAEVAAAALKLTGALEAKQGKDGVQEPTAGESALQGGLPPGPGMTKIFLNLGRAQRIRPADVVGAIANEAGIAGEAIGAIDIYDNFTLVEVPAKDAARVASALNQSKLRGQRVKVELRAAKQQGSSKAHH
ncbi:MAG: DEAD/DEAH box helicase [Dehalococcoidia bacterium]|nr:DEAD/DEAH box helicase [Dehalococcoidia bacterium]